ncbi:MAG: hypothetical protein GY822_15905 [Deltaproteobacteria bacterium]|nr:hypothetical protein [Deltaproteobacteria bacterium]
MSAFQKCCDKLGFSVEQEGLLGDSCAFRTWREHRIRLEYGSEMQAEMLVSFTKISFAVHSVVPISLEARHMPGRLSKWIWTLGGLKDTLLGHEKFDQTYLVQTSLPEDARFLIDDEKRNRLLENPIERILIRRLERKGDKDEAEENNLERAVHQVEFTVFRTEYDEKTLRSWLSLADSFCTSAE